MNSQEYELAFVEVLPSGVAVVDPSTLDFSKNPAGALAFRYKHGWILINPLVPSRGLSGGGLARQHGHISGGHTTGHFLKGADGKMSFKAVNRYASKADWEAEVKKGAAGVVAKQEAAKAAVQKAESATHAASELAKAGASKDAQALAHKVAADAHGTAATHFQAMGKDGLKSAVLTHSAHSAIHSSKAAKLAQEAKAEHAAKLEAEKAAKAKKLAEQKASAKKLTDEANDLSAHVKATHDVTPQDAADLHTKAKNAHLKAKQANEEAGNAFTAEAHGGAAAKHEKIAANNQKSHDAVVAGAKKQSANAFQASKSAKIAGEEGDTLPSQIQAHLTAADAHGQAANLHQTVGNTDVKQVHLTHKTEHQAKAATLKQEHETQQKAEAEAKAQAQQHEKEGLSAAGVAAGHGETPEGVAAHLDAADSYKKAAKAAKAAGLHEDAKDHEANAKAHEGWADQIDGKLAAKAEEEKAAKVAKLHASGEATTKAAKATDDANDADYSGGDAKGIAAKHLDAATAHADAAQAANDVEHHALAEDHIAAAKGHTAKAEKINKMVADSEAAAKQKQDLITQAGKLFNEADDALTAGDKDKALAAYKQVVDLADKADAHPTKTAALTAIASITGTQKDHQAAGQAAVKALVAEGNKDKPSAFYTNKYTHLVEEHAAKAKTAGDLEAAAKAAAIPPPLTAKAPKNVVTTQEVGGLHFGLVDGEQVVGPYMNPGMASTQAKKWLAKSGGLPQTPALKPTNADGEVVLKPVGKLTGTGKQLGSHDNEVLVDEAGNKWLKKADSEGYSRVLDPALASLQRKVGIETPVFVKTKEGHLQGMIPGAKDAFPKGEFDPEKLSPDDVMKMLQHQVLDFATGNQDTHSGQWLRNPDGSLTQVDQAQAFKFGVGKGSGGGGKGDPTTTFTPNYPDTPVYPKLWNAAESGKVKIPDPNGDNDFAKTIQSLQDMPDAEFQALFKPYAVQVLKNGKNPGGNATVQGFLDDITEHKNNLGKEFEKLYNKLPDSAKDTPAAGSAPDAGKPLSKDAQQALDAVHVWAEGNDGKPLEPWMKSMAKEAGLSDAQIDKAMSDGKQLTQKNAALKGITQLLSSDDEIPPGAYAKLKLQAKAAGATQDEIKAAIMGGETPPAPVHASSAPAGLSAQDKALKAIAEHEHPDNQASWSYNKSNELEAQAKAAGVGADDLHTAFHKPEEVLKSLQAKEGQAKPETAGAGPSTAAPEASVPTKPKADPFKPKAKWSKTDHTAKDANGEVHSIAGVKGPKGLVVHKSISGTGWAVTQDGGLKMGSAKFKTQKEAKLAAEWMAKNYGGKSFTSEEFSKWKDENPAEFTKFKQGVLGGHWNKEAQAELDQHNGVAAPAAPAAANQMSSKEAALKKLAEHNLPQNGDDWDHGKNEDLKDAAAAAGASPAEIGSATIKPKTFINSLEGKSAAPEQKILFTGLTNNKQNNAQLLKKLYNQAHGPNATSADMAEYVKAQDAWIKKHSTGPFDPAKVLAPGELPAPGSTPNPQKGKQKFPVSKGYAGWTPYNPAAGSTYGLGTTDRTELSNITKAQWGGDTHAAGYRSASFNQSLHGDWKPDPEDAGYGSGPHIYSTNHYSAINQQLRGNKKKGIEPFGPTGGKWDDVIAHMDKVFNDVPPLDKNVVVSRKMHGSGPFPDAPPPMVPGEEFIDHGYNSTSKSRDVWSGDTQMEIRLPKGSKVLDLNHTTGSDNSSEQEVLLNRDSKFRVVADKTSTYQGQKVRHIVVELVP